jgi:hypothetical protein
MRQAVTGALLSVTKRSTGHMTGQPVGGQEPRSPVSREAPRKCPLPHEEVDNCARLQQGLEIAIG